VDRKGQEEPIKAPPRAYVYARLSPDGTRIAVDIRDQDNDIWIWDIARETLTRLTFEAGFNRGPVWTPDGRRLASSTLLDGAEAIHWRAADGTGKAERLSKGATVQMPTSFTPDGRQLIFSQPGVTPFDIGVVDLAGDRAETLLLSEPKFSETNGALSPDGRWLAYQSNESGREEIYVRPFPTINDGRWQVSNGGGSRPVWARNGRELFYYRPPGTVMAVTIPAGATFAAGNPQQLFAGRYAAVNAGFTYDVSPDGKRFLMIKPVDVAQDAEQPRLVVVQNWFQELERLAPVK
jgi:Tol biopolymer transport system component